MCAPSSSCDQALASLRCICMAQSACHAGLTVLTVQQKMPLAILRRRLPSKLAAFSEALLELHEKCPAGDLSWLGVAWIVKSHQAASTLSVQLLVCMDLGVPCHCLVRCSHCALVRPAGGTNRHKGRIIQ